LPSQNIMNYSVVPSGVYSVPDVRLTRQGLYGERPTSFIRPGLPITPVNMLPYQGGPVPYGYTLVPQTMVPQQRLMLVQPGTRTRYSVVDYDDEEPEEYVPIRPKKRSSDIINDIIDSPEMDEFSAKTRQIRKDAESVLQRLNTSRPTSSRASDFFRTYDYDRRPLLQRYPSPLPERTLTRSPYLEEEDEPLTSRRSYRYSGASSLRPTSAISPINLTKERVRSVYQDLEEPIPFRAPRTYDFAHPDSVSLRNPSDKVKAEINRKAMLKEPSKAIGRSSSLKSRIGCDANEVRNNISIRAHYAAMREAASRDVSLRKPKDIMP